jgi:hypothetical protein
MDLFFVYSLANLVSFSYTLQSSELLSLGMPDFPVENLKYVVEIMVNFDNCYFLSGKRFYRNTALAFI